MADMMEFPDTVEEFMEAYKLIDSDQVYSNGMEFVPIFRMKQWFDHKKGRWVDTTHGLICSACKTYQVYGSRYFNYCPICGADMRGD